MRILTLRLTISLIVGITLISLLSSYYEVRFQKRGLRRDMEHRAEVLGESLADKVEPYLNLKKDSRKELQLTVDRFATREHLTGVAVYNDQGESLAITPLLAPRLTSEPAMVQQAAKQGQSAGVFIRLGEAPVYIYALPLHQGEAVVGGLAIVDDASYINVQRQTDLARDVSARARAGFPDHAHHSSDCALEHCRAQLPARRNGCGLCARVSLLPGRPSPIWICSAHSPTKWQTSPRALPRLAPLPNKKRSCVRPRNRSGLPNGSRCTCAAGSGEPPVRCSEPRALHPQCTKARCVEAIVPASGLVTALEPVLRACDGTWVAHGNGDADRETVDQHDRLRVPPEDPRYTLRRVWLSKEEEEGYYYGFANEGLWPLCHIAHTRPVFRVSDWEHYRSANGSSPTRC